MDKPWRRRHDRGAKLSRMSHPWSANRGILRFSHASNRDRLFVLPCTSVRTVAGRGLPGGITTGRGVCC